MKLHRTITRASYGVRSLQELLQLNFPRQAAWLV
jgi:hypothetical protein